MIKKNLRTKYHDDSSEVSVKTTIRNLELVLNALQMASKNPSCQYHEEFNDLFQECKKIHQQACEEDLLSRPQSPKAVDNEIKDSLKNLADKLRKP